MLTDKGANALLAEGEDMTLKIAWDKWGEFILATILYLYFKRQLKAIIPPGADTLDWEQERFLEIEWDWKQRWGEGKSSGVFIKI